MEIGKRIRQVRRMLDLSQQAFASRVDMKRNSIAQIEGGRGTSDQTIRVICREFNVSETWLRTGEGEMFNPPPTDEMDALAGQYGLSESEQALMKKFITLNPAKRKTALDYLGEVVAAVNADSAPYEA